MDFWDATIRFFSLTDANVRWVVLGSALLGGAAGGLGAFAFLQRKSLLGDVLAHAALPGVGLAFLIIGTKQFAFLLLGAAVAAWLGALAINAIMRHTKIKQDAALGIVLSTFFGLGIVILTYIQKTGVGSQSGLNVFLFGQAAAMGPDDVKILAVVGALLLIVMGAAFGRFKLITFDAGFARSAGIRVGWWQFLLTTMIVLAVVIGLQAVGVVLMAALLVIPAASARQWTDRLGLLIVLASIFGIVSGVLGAYFSSLAPRLPTGPFVVVAVSVVFLFSILFAPQRGLVSRWRQHLQNRRKMSDDHILKVLFKACGESGAPANARSPEEIADLWSFTMSELRSGLKRLTRRGLLNKVDGNRFCLTPDGHSAGAAVVRRHRLWEVYLTRYLDLPHDHVHRDAEDMEHIMTPQMEKQLEELLDRPERDPHDQVIPYEPREAER
ncbi:zinc ABC transporter permease [candidate division GN15 bacterium]|nr:zinc ABC transporter permease [candidate division GN15 bacterium]